MDRRAKDWNWNVLNDVGQCQSTDHAQLAVLMDIRDELKEINKSLMPLRCSNFTAIPRILRRISFNTAKPKKKRKK